MTSCQLAIFVPIVTLLCNPLLSMVWQKSRVPVRARISSYFATLETRMLIIRYFTGESLKPVHYLVFRRSEGGSVMWYFFIFLLSIILTHEIWSVFLCNDGIPTFNHTFLDCIQELSYVTFQFMSFKQLHQIFRHSVYILIELFIISANEIINK